MRKNALRLSLVCILLLQIHIGLAIAGHRNTTLTATLEKVKSITISVSDPDGLRRIKIYGAVGPTDINLSGEKSYLVKGLWSQSENFEVYVADNEQFPQVSKWIIWLGDPPPVEGPKYVEDIPKRDGGVLIPVNKFDLLAPYIGFASTIIVATVATAICVKRIKCRKGKP